MSLKALGKLDERLLSQWCVEPPQELTVAMYTQFAAIHACRVKNDPLREDLLAKLHAQDVRGLCGMALPLNDDTLSVSDLIEARQVLGFFTKLEGLDLGVDKEAKALEVFMESEEACRLANGKFLKLTRSLEGNTYDPKKSDVPLDLLNQLLEAREKIRWLLGDAPALSQLKPRFGGGATTSVKKKDACARNKLHGRIGCSRRLIHSGLLDTLLGETPHWTALHSSYSIDAEPCEGDASGAVWPATIAGNEVFSERVRVSLEAANLSFVPKDWAKHRATVTEPTLNTAWQLAVGDVMSLALNRVGISLKDQSRNRRLAREGSLTGRLATIDLSSASDRIARWVVKFLLPADWYYLLDSLRSDEVRYRGELIQLQKFSSMGNGFTFPLESIIFWALSASAAEGLVSVYGDDIICESENFDSVVRLLECCGFAVNGAKSFAQGPFRESCGHDYFRGIQTRPCFMKHGASLKSLYRLHNFHVSQYDTEAAQAVLEWIPEELRTWGPDSQGDGHLHDRNYVVDGKYRARTGDGFRGYTFLSIRVKASRVSDANRWSGDYVTPLYERAYGSALSQGEWKPRLSQHYGVNSHACRRYVRKLALKFEPSLEPCRKTGKGTGKNWGDPQWDLPTCSTADEIPVGEAVRIYNFAP